MNKKNTSQKDKETARRLYSEGAEAWKNGDRAKAITLYSESAAIDPDGPGVQALQMSNDIMDFFDTNRLNP